MALNLDLKNGRMTAENIPAIGSFQVKLAYANQTLSCNEFKGELGGGTFKLGGTVKMPELDQLSFGPKMHFPPTIEPIFDLRLESDEVLVMRNDSITVRADSDVKLTGPLKAAAATGTIYITHSRFFKEIDILPIGLPGRPKPAPKSAPRQSNISFPNPPLRDWKFDIAIKTRADDPFLVRGNLANGAAALSLRFTGTGLKPWLDGTIHIESFNANLPFSRLSVTRGYVYFKEDAPFQPMLDLQAESRARDYLVGAYIYGSASSPQISLTSEPPLPHADIVSLLATGTTTAELGGNAEALASRAAMLAVKQLYQKLFKRGTPPPPTKANTEDGNLMDRFQMELGGTDNRTGGQQVITRFKVNDQLYLIGDAGVDGQFTGRLKYLIRFR
jgi:TamB, inner membrane protein subunit of TAM complex